MAAVAGGRKDEWLALFTPDAAVEDPSVPRCWTPRVKGHHGQDGIAKFWDQNFGAVSRVAG
jgi:steroid delta-isomerase